MQQNAFMKILFQKPLNINIVEQSIFFLMNSYRQVKHYDSYIVGDGVCYTDSYKKLMKG